MKDKELIDGLRTCTLTEDQFRHTDHIRAAWLYLERWGLGETLQRFAADLRCFAAKQGQPGLYHETITWTFLLAVNKRRRQLPSDHVWAEFVDNFPELLDWKSFVGRYYSNEMLSSDLARREFVLPDGVDPTVPRMLG